MTYSLPLKIGLPPKSSARIHPTDHTSIAVVYIPTQARQLTLCLIFRSEFMTHVIRKAQHNLRRPIPSRRNIFSHKSLVPTPLLCLLCTSPGCIASRQPKIANLQLAIGINEQITRFQITVKDIGRVDVFKATERLVQEGLEMGVR